jgi:asparagine synthase (glutamine-hydrolysing)
MCGIYIHCHYGKKFASYKTSSLESRGPDDHKIVETKDYRCEFYRLAIMPDAPQPVQIESVIVMFNGEIYNFNDLRTKYGLVVTTECELIAQMYRLLGVYKTIAALDGEFAIVIVDTYTEFVYAFRDKFGVKPLYYSLEIAGGMFRVEISSDVKSLQYLNVNHLQPKKLHVFNSSTIAIHPIEEYYYEKCKLITHAEIFTALQVAVAKRITHTARPIGFLLSGGLDSSIILAIAIVTNKIIIEPIIK